MKNNKGFFAVEAIASFSIFLTIMLTLLPLVYQLKTDQETLSQRRYVQTELQGQMLEYLHPAIPENQENYEIKLKETHPAIAFQFNEDNNLIKGCATWKNAKNIQENFCIYGKRT